MNANTDNLNTQISESAGPQLIASSSSYSVQTSAFTNARDVRIDNSSLSFITNFIQPSEPLKVLFERVAPHAISNEGGRADNPKCHPGTREELISLLERWMTATESDRILWLSGPAGGGKTAIMKTISDHSTDRGVCIINFYFFRGDSTRNGTQPVVPTFLYQLFEHYPPCKEVVANVLSSRPRIFDGSLVEQFKLVSMLSPIIRQSLPAGAPVLLLVDGLDECDVDAGLSQGQLICTLASLVMDEDSPFRLLIASRPEAGIRMAFNQLLSPAQTIFLDEQYSPEKDIRVFVTAEFAKIKLSHPSAHLLKGNWPLPSDVDEIVRKSSGQFIYAATVMRYISHPSTVSSLSLKRVQGIVPAGKNSPFTHLDSIYTLILAQVDNPEATRDMLSVMLLPEINSEHMRLLHHYNSCNSHELIESCVSQLSAIIQFTQSKNLKFYHASLADFLVDQDRSGMHWVDVQAFRVKLLIGIWTVPYLHAQSEMFKRLQTPDHDVTHMLLNLPLPSWITSKNVNHMHRVGVQSLTLQAIHQLYDMVDDDTCQQIIQRLKEDPSWLYNPELIMSLHNTDEMYLANLLADYMIPTQGNNAFSAEGNNLPPAKVNNIIPPTEANNIPLTKADNTHSTSADDMPPSKICLFSFHWWCKILCISHLRNQGRM